MGAPTAVAIAFAAAATAIGGATYIGQKRAADTQGILDEAAIDLQREQSRMQAAEAATIHATSFRKAMASQVALASLRGGAGSVARQFGASSYSNFLQDQEAIKRGVRLSDIQALHSLSQSKANKSASNMRALGAFAKTSLDAWNFSSFSGGGDAATTTKAATQTAAAQGAGA